MATQSSAERANRSSRLTRLKKWAGNICALCAGPRRCMTCCKMESAALGAEMGWAFMGIRSGKRGFFAARKDTAQPDDSPAYGRAPTAEKLVPARGYRWRPRLLARLG